MIPEGMRDVLPPETGRAAGGRGRRCATASPPTATARCARRGWSSRRRSSRPTTTRSPPATACYDEQGHQLMVRTDMTVPVARLAADRCDDDPLPLRFCYVAPVHPPVGAAAQPGRRVPAGRRRAAGAGLGRGRRRVRHPALRRARGARPARLHASTLGSVAYQRALIDSLGLPDEDRETLHRGPRRPRLPAGGERRRQRRRGVRRAQGPLARPRAQRRRGDARPGAQARAQRRDGGGGRPPRPRARPRGGGRVRRASGVRLRPHAGPQLLLRPHRRGVRARRRPARRHRRPLRRAAGAVRLGHPRRGLRRRRGPRRRRPRRGRRRSSCPRRPPSRSSAGWRRRRGRRSSAAPASPSWRCPRTPAPWRRRCCCAAAAPYTLRLADGREVTGGAGEIAEALGSG